VLSMGARTGMGKLLQKRVDSGTESGTLLALRIGAQLCAYWRAGRSSACGLPGPLAPGYAESACSRTYRWSAAVTRWKQAESTSWL